MSCPNYKIIFNDETKYVVQDITEEPVVRVIPARGEQGPQGEQGIQGEQGPKGEDGKNFEPTIVSELPATGEENKLYLTPKAHTTQTATGNPITATVAEDAGAIESFQLDGDTFQKSYTGKNLLDVDEFVTVGGYTGLTVEIVNKNESTGSFGLKLTGNVSANLWSIYGRTNDFQLKPNTTYTLSRTFSVDGEQLTGSGGIRIKNGSSYTATTYDASVTFTTDATGLVQILVYASYNQSGPSTNIDTTINFSNLQLEESSTATSFEPYVGGMASPNPDYPQPIQMVTGTQTISINGTDYPIDLGDIELCKLGTYQDYIWKDGDDWKVHKAISNITLDGTEAWIYADNYNYARCPSYTFVDKPLGGTGLGLQLSNYFGVITDWGTFRDSTGQNAFFPLLDEGYKISIRNTGCSSVENYKSWFATNKPSFYYPVATPTDTTITDQTLIAQLEAISTASLENGANTITNTATDPNLAGDMEIGYYGYNPRNRYDKWLWLDINNEYEQLNNPDTTTTNLSSERNLSLTNIQPVSNEINKDEEQENVTFNDVEDL